MKLLVAIAAGALIMTSAAAEAQTRPAVEHSGKASHNGQPLPFSEAVRVGDVLYLSGQIGVGADGKLPAGIQAQTRQALNNIGAILTREGVGYGNVFHCTAMLADMKLWPDFNKAYLEIFNEPPLPTRSAFGANGLALGALVEIECQAYAGAK
jgi:enamine deaminase RidA (YjgF/YER057c/UK114 family)